MNHRLRRTFSLVASALIGFSGSTIAATNAPEETGQGMELGKIKSVYTIPDKALAPEITAPNKISGSSAAVPIRVLSSAQN